MTSAYTDVAADELALALKAFTKDELLVEADGWQALVRAKAVEIAKAEVAVKRQNKEIEKAGEIAEQAGEAKQDLRRVEQKAKEAEISGDAEAMKDAEEAAQEAKEKMDQVRESTREIAEAADKTAEIYDLMSDETKQGLEDTTGVDETVVASEKARDAIDQVQAAAEGAAAGSRTDIMKAATETKDASTAAQAATDEVSEKAQGTASHTAEVTGHAINDAALAMETAREAKKGEKVDWLVRLNSLREERILLVDNLRVVVDELASKTDGEDGDTQAKIKDYRLYIHAVRGINFDYWDVYWDVTKEVKRRFDSEGIGTPFPQQDVHLYIQDGPAVAALSSSSARQAGPTASSQPKQEDGGLDKPDD